MNARAHRYALLAALLTGLVLATGLGFAQVRAGGWVWSVAQAGLVLGTSAAAAILGARVDRMAEDVRRWRALAVTDELTSLKNARYFHERLRAECARAEREGTPFAVVYADLDRFKDLNDSYGHLVGDRALQHVARLLASQMRTGDVACRIGGEEFAVLCAGASEDDGRAIAERLKTLFEDNPLPLGGDLVRLTASFGVAAHRVGELAEALLDRADRALYAAKAEGRNRVRVAVNELTGETRSADPTTRRVAICAG